jgi:membrane-bound lytic murein transglycosylase D
MNRRQFLTLTSLFPLAAAGRPGQASFEDLLGAGEKLLRENVDPQTLRTLQQNVDPAQAQAVLRDIQTRFQGQYVIDVARLRSTAQALLPVLEQLPQTRAYAGWLRPRLDYFDVADQLQIEVPPPKAVPGQPAPAPVNPSPVQERRAWTVKVAKGSTPKGAATWVPTLKPVFASQRVPPELVWLAEVESSFDPLAQSPVGAGGLYQLMPATAQSLGLKLKPEDERFIGEKNGRAAAGYLRQLYGKFRDWRLTLAAYNAGEGRVRDLLQTRRAKTYDEIATRLPAETQMYVPKVEAVVQRREGKSLQQLPPARA